MAERVNQLIQCDKNDCNDLALRRTVMGVGSHDIPWTCTIANDISLESCPREFGTAGSMERVQNCPVPPNAPAPASGINPSGPRDIEDNRPRTQPIDEGTANFRSLTPVLSVPIPGVSFGDATLSDGEVTVPFLAQYIMGIYRFAIGAAAILASIMVVYGGFRYLLGSTLGDVKEGKEVIQNAVIGLIVLLCSYVILQSINPDLVTLRALRLNYQERLAEPEPEHLDTPNNPGSSSSSSGSSGGSTGSSGWGIPGNGSPHTRPNTVTLVDAPSDDCIHLTNEHVNPQLVEPLRQAGQIFCRLRASASGGGSWQIRAADSARTMDNQFRTWLSNGCNTANGCGSPTCSPFAAGYTPVPGTSEAELRQHLGDPLQCPHTSGIALDLFCGGTPNARSSGQQRYPYVPCQLLLERAMLEAGFCRLRQEPWHFELNSLRVSGSNCINNTSDIVGKVQAERTEPVYDYSACTGTWNFRNRASESCSRAINTGSAGGSAPSSGGTSGAALPPARRGLPEPSGGLTGTQFSLRILGISDAAVGQQVLNEIRAGRLDAGRRLMPPGTRILSETARENAVVEAINGGHYPAFLSQFIPINVEANGHRGTFYVAPDMLAIGTNADYLRVPMSARSAQQIANHYGLLLPTKKMIDAMMRSSNVQKERLTGHDPYDSDRAHPFLYIQTNKEVQDQRNTHFDGSLRTAYIGGKKNVVIGQNMSERRPRDGHCPDLRVWIYGGIRPDGSMTQSFSSIHDEGYFDYSHGINLVGAEMLVDGSSMPISQVLADRTLSALISDTQILDPRYPLTGPIELCP